VPELHYVLYAVLGMLAGVLAGLMGIGGGLVIVPGLLFLFYLQGFESPFLSHIAIASSLVVIIPVSISSMWAHHRCGAVDWLMVRRLAPGLMLGALLGAWLATQISTASLKMVFGLFLFVVAYQMLLERLPRQRHTASSSLLFLAAGTVIGSISGLVGIGGGTMSVPFLVWLNKPLPRAVATSAACGLPIAIAGTLGFTLLGKDVDISAVSGFVYWPAVVAIAVFAVLCAPAGAYLAHHLPVAMLKKLFALILIMVGLRLLLSAH
jgi:uncharacterized membrane protein YfcA